MKLRELIADWPRWPGWRRYAPAAGSVATHLVLGLAVVSMLAATGKPQRMGVFAPPMIAVTLVSETPPPRGIRPTPPDAPKTPPQAEPKAEALPEKPPAAKDQRKDQKQQAAKQPETSATASTDEGGVYLGESSIALSGVPLGLRSLLETDPCHPKKGLPRGDCGPTWEEKFAKNQVVIIPTAQQLQRMYPGIVLPCRWKVGCEGGEWISTNGTRSFGGKSPMASGAGGLQGIHDLVGRLPQNPDFTDPGFGD